TAANFLPPTPRYFTQMTALFPKATQYSFEYRAQAFTCADRAWHELDFRRWFPMHADDKENRFQRLGFFYVSRPNRTVIYALEDWLIAHHNAAAEAGDAGDGVAGKIGGIELYSLRDPVPPVGEELERYEWKPMDAYPADVERKLWFHTPES